MRIWSSACTTWWPREPGSLFMMPLRLTWLTENVKVAFTKENKFSWNSWQIDLSSATPEHVSFNTKEEVDALDQGWPNPWIYSQYWLPKEAIERTKIIIVSRITGAWSDICKEKIKSLIVKCSQNMNFFYDSLVRSLPLFSVYTLFQNFKMQSRIGVCMMNGQTMYMSKYSNDFHEIIHFWSKHRHLFFAVDNFVVLITALRF